MNTVSASPGTAGTEPVPGQVFRSELNPVDFLYRAAYMYPDKAAVVDGERRYSYRQLAERSWRLAGALRAAGLAKGDRVATLLFNSAAMLEAHFGVPAAGTPKCASSIAAELNSSVATRSPLARPAARSAPASRHERSASCR